MAPLLPILWIWQRVESEVSQNAVQGRLEVDLMCRGSATFNPKLMAECLKRDAIQLFPVPAFFDYAETREAMWRERSVKRVLELQRRADIALFSVGGLTGEVPSHVYSAGYLEHEDFALLEHEGVVGDVCTVFLREDGSYSDLVLNERATGPTPAELQMIPRRLCAAAGNAKITPIRAALKAGVATHLIVDEPVASQLIEKSDLHQ